MILVGVPTPIPILPKLVKYENPAVLSVGRDKEMHLVFFT